MVRRSLQGGNSCEEWTRICRFEYRELLGTHGPLRQELPVYASSGRQFRTGLCGVLIGLACGSGCVSTPVAEGPQGKSKPSAIALVSFHSPQKTRAAEWNAWANDRLQSGDVVFLRGDNRILLDLVNFSEFVSTLTDSPWSHVGLVSVEDGEAVVYDIRQSGGMHRTPFGTLLTNPEIHAVAVRRPTGEARAAIPAAVQFVQDVHQRRVRFDTRFEPDESRFYCAELVECAFRSGGVPLSQPVRISELPGFGRERTVEAVLQRVARVTADQAVYVPGNNDLGLWSNPALHPVILVRDTRVRPQDVTEFAAE
jgi:hypothetical protein